MAPPRFSVDNALRALRARISEISRDFETSQLDTINETQRDEAGFRAQDLENNWKACEDGYFELCGHVTDQQREELPFFVQNEYQQAKEQFRKAFLIFNRLSAPSNVPAETPIPEIYNSTPVLPAYGQHLERLEKPTFNGDRTQWVGFRDAFESRIINTNLSNVTKLNYLKASLTGIVSGLLRNLTSSNNNFDRAWSMLTQRYENPRLLKQAHVRAFKSIPAVSRPRDANEYTRVINSIDEHLLSLEGLGVNVQGWGDLLLFDVMEKFDKHLLVDWEEHVSDADIDPTYEIFKKFVWRRCEACRNTSANPESSKPSSFRKTVRAHTTSSFPLCPDCSSDHRLYVCPRFQAKSSELRLLLVRKKNLCFNCLASNHTSQRCVSRQTCRLCNQKHHTSLHDALCKKFNLKRKVEANDSTIQANDSSAGKQANLTSMHVEWEGIRGTLLATARVRVTSCQGETLFLRALIDQGSEVSLISSRAVQTLKVQKRRCCTKISGVGGKVTDTVQGVAAITIGSRFDDSISIKLDAFILSRLTAYVPPRSSIDVTTLSHISGLQLADDDPTGSEKIDLILGAEIYAMILCNNMRAGRLYEPIAQSTKLGWILSGSMSSSVYNNSNSVQVSVSNVAVDVDLNETLRLFWEVEQVPEVSSFTPEQERCEQVFISGSSRSSDGRYTVPLPFSRDPLQLGDSENMARRTFQRLEKRLAKNSDLRSRYDGFLDEYLSLGHMSLDTDNNAAFRYFLPHHPVIKESSSTTKLRVVFNASARTSTGISLNDCLHVGPKLHQELVDVVSRWRLHRYVFSADIEKMFRQILISPDDRSYQCIFWRAPGSEDIKIYRLNTVTYGTASAPYLSMRVLQQLAIDEAARYPLGSKVLSRDFYVDDAMFGADSVGECLRIRDELIALLKSGGFSLRKWDSNDDTLIHDLPEDTLANDVTKSLGSEETTKVLGLSWHKNDDSFVFRFQPRAFEQVTRRKILSFIASLFDPLGWIAPVIVVAKIFMQKLWKETDSWDRELNNQLRNEWLSFYDSLKAISQVKIPRWVGTFVSTHTCELHGFADASKRAYAAVIYLVVRSGQGTQVSLLVSKTRVAPLKELSIPRLELCAADLLSQLTLSLKRSNEFSNLTTICWSDSTIVLSWLKHSPCIWKQFVSNRVLKIQERLPEIEWRHVPTQDNPADIASRGSSAVNLSSYDLWWSGPSWLKYERVNWPDKMLQQSDEIFEERKVINEVDRGSDEYVTIHTLNETVSLDLIAEKFSSWRQLLHFTARIKYWMNVRCNTAYTLTEGVQDSETFWLRHVQRCIFSKEVRDLGDRKTAIARVSKLYAIDPFFDNVRGLIRAGGRIRRAECDFATRCPVLLGAHHVTNLIVHDAHMKTLHGGAQLMHRTLREKFWIFRARNLVRACINKCVVCVRHRAQPMQQKMGDLPSIRVNPSRPFSNVGVDYAGPFVVRALPGRGHAGRKGYIAVFVCMCTRAMHLEFVSDYTSEAFMAAFKRFSSRRGVPSYVFSDNGTTFHGAERELRESFKKLTKNSDLAIWFANERVNWRFMPPAAPFFGGIYEAGVKSVKHHLRRMIGTHVLTFEEMCTLLSQIEACLNSRPISPMSDSFDDFSYLTPAHFLTGSPVLSVPEFSLIEVAENRLSRWQLIQKMRERFWHIWRNDYLLQLQQRRKWCRVADNLFVGDLVLIVNDLAPPAKWEIGRVIEIHTGDDGLVRVAKVKTAKSVFLRPIRKLCLLPIRTANLASNNDTELFVERAK